MGYTTSKSFWKSTIVILLVMLLALGWSGAAWAAKPPPPPPPTPEPGAYDLNVDEDADPPEYQAAIINEAIFETYRSGTSTGTGVFESFLRVQADPTSMGYNSGVKNSGLEFDTKGGKWTHEIELARVPYVGLTVTPTQRPGDPKVPVTVYGRELLMDINEADKTPEIFLNEFQVWLTTDPNLTGYNASTHQFNNPDPVLVWDLNVPENNQVVLDYEVAAGSGKGDYRTVIPEVYFRNALQHADMDFSAAYLVVFVEFTECESGFEEVGIIPKDPAIKSGIKFHDRNANGVKDEGEEGLKGWTIYADVDFDGVLDAGEIYDETDKDGYYELSLAPGEYHIREEMVAGWTQSLPISVYGTVYYPERFLGGEIAENNDFGNWQPATKSGVKFEDKNADGYRDPGDEGLGGWIIFVDYDDDSIPDALEPQTVTDVYGDYTIEGIKPGTWKVREVIQSGWNQSLPFNVIGTVYYEETFDSGDELTGNDFGNWYPATKSGTKFEDMNGDGNRDPGDDGLENWTIFVDYNDNEAWDEGEPKAVTDVYGDYTIGDIKPGTWKVREDMKTGWTQTLPLSVYGTVYYEETFESRDTLTGNDFGNWYVATKSGTKFEDMNADGDRDPGDDGLENWTIFLDYNGNESWDTGEPKDVTDINGDYTLTDIKPGTWKVWEELKSGWTQTLPYSVYGTVYYEETFVSSEIKTGNDFGNWYPATKSGTKFEDMNGDGDRDPGEDGLENWTIFVDYDGNEAWDTGEPKAVTDVYGDYTLTGVKPGTWKVWEEMKSGWTQTLPFSVYGTVYYEETFESRGVLTGNDFGNWYPATKSGTKFNDMDRDGVWDGGEPGMPDWTIFVDYNDDGVWNTGEPKDVTDGDGNYTIMGIKPGTWKVREVMKTDWIQTLPLSVYGTVYYEETFASRGSFTGNNFGNTSYRDETAWAYGNNENLDYTDSQNWGWNNGPVSIPAEVYGSVTYRYELYAGAGDNTPASGTLVGAVYAHVRVASATEVEVTVTYVVDGAYALGDTHVWIGATPLPWKDPDDHSKGMTDAPGKLIYVHGQTVTVNRSDPLYIAAHCIVRM